MRADERFALVAISYRGKAADNWHFGAAAVATPAGDLVAGLGDPGLGAFLRSAAKPFQALPLVTGGGVERWQLEAADLALVCGSHAGRDEHVERARALLERGGFTPADLACGAHPPFDEAAAEALRRRGEAPGPLHNNCSGKHAGMLLTCRLLGLPTAGYLAPGHPLQQRLTAELLAFTGLEPARIGTGVDGCGAPTYRLPLAATARGYAALADPRAAPLDGERRAAATRLVEAMTSEPAMVAGSGRFTTSLMEVTGGRVLGKEGAAGFYAAAVRGPAALGLALKIADGSESCRDGVVLDLLRQVGALSGDELSRLSGFHRRSLRNWSGQEVGELVPEAELEQL